MDIKKFRDLFITVLGLWLMMSPRLLHFAAVDAQATWNTWAVGAAVILLTAVSRYLVDTRTPWEDLLGIALGFWLMISPWVLEFSAHVTVRNNSLGIGLLVSVSALQALMVDGNVRKLMGDWMQQHHLPR